MENFMLDMPIHKQLCSFLDEPFDECYCSKMSSQDIERAIYLCSKNFDICDICIDVGFANSQSYRRTFKRRLNISPTEFKRLLITGEENKLHHLNLFKNHLWNDKRSAFMTGEISP